MNCKTISTGTGVKQGGSVVPGPVMLVQRAAGNSSNSIHRLHPQPVYHCCQQFSSPSVAAEEALDQLPMPRRQQKPSKSRTSCSSASSSASASSSGDFLSREQREEFSPGDFFAKQSMRSSQMAGKGKTRVRFHRENKAFGDLLLADHANVEFEIIERSVVNGPEERRQLGREEEKPQSSLLAGEAN